MPQHYSQEEEWAFYNQEEEPQNSFIGPENMFTDSNPDPNEMNNYLSAMRKVRYSKKKYRSDPMAQRQGFVDIEEYMTPEEKVSFRRISPIMANYESQWLPNQALPQPQTSDEKIAFQAILESKSPATATEEIDLTGFEDPVEPQEEGNILDTFRPDQGQLNQMAGNINDSRTDIPWQGPQNAPEEMGGEMQPNPLEEDEEAYDPDEGVWKRGADFLKKEGSNYGVKPTVTTPIVDLHGGEITDIVALADQLSSWDQGDSPFDPQQAYDYYVSGKEHYWSDTGTGNMVRGTVIDMMPPQMQQAAIQLKKIGDELPENPLGSVANYLAKEFNLQKSDVIEEMSQIRNKLKEDGLGIPHWVLVAMVVLMELSKPGSGVAIASALGQMKEGRDDRLLARYDQLDTSLNKYSPEEMLDIRNKEADLALKNQKMFIQEDTRRHQRGEALDDRVEETVKNIQIDIRKSEDQINRINLDSTSFMESLSKGANIHHGEILPENKAVLAWMENLTGNEMRKQVTLQAKIGIIREAQSNGFAINPHDADKIANWTQKAEGLAYWLIKNNGKKISDPDMLFEFPMNLQNQAPLGLDNPPAIPIQGIGEITQAAENLNRIANNPRYRNAETGTQYFKKLAQTQALLLNEFQNLRAKGKRERQEALKHENKRAANRNKRAAAMKKAIADFKRSQGEKGSQGSKGANQPTGKRLQELPGHTKGQRDKPYQGMGDKIETATGLALSGGRAGPNAGVHPWPYLEPKHKERATAREKELRSLHGGKHAGGAGVVGTRRGPMSTLFGHLMGEKNPRME